MYLYQEIRFFWGNIQHDVIKKRLMLCLFHKVLYIYIYMPFKLLADGQLSLT